MAINPLLFLLDSDVNLAQYCGVFPPIAMQVMSDIFATPMDCNPPGSSVHGISQARILKWVAISFSRGSF